MPHDDHMQSRHHLYPLEEQNVQRRGLLDQELGRRVPERPPLLKHHVPDDLVSTFGVGLAQVGRSEQQSGVLHRNIGLLELPDPVHEPRVQVLEVLALVLGRLVVDEYLFLGTEEFALGPGGRPRHPDQVAVRPEAVVRGRDRPAVFGLVRLAQRVRQRLAQEARPRVVQAVHVYHVLLLAPGVRVGSPKAPPRRARARPSATCT
mmetsp:Transcript_18299/g.42073  ORF Transcript_18299/g.42073 Transcript_18299/m.42073 type:complete len:205 (+) Transcript_18299:769-1383(+)